MSTLFRDNVPELMGVGLNKVFFDALDLVGDEFSDVFNMDTSDRKYETDVGYVGFTPFSEKAEGASIAYETIQEAYKKVYTFRTFAKGFRTTMETLQDDQYDVVAKATKELGTLLQFTKNQDASNVFNRAFNTSYTGPDGVTL